MRALFVFPAIPLVENHSGAASRYRQNFLALHKLCAEVHVVSVSHDENIALAAQGEGNVSQLAASWENLIYKPVNTRGHAAYWDLLFRPSRYQFPNSTAIANALRFHLDRVQPTLIWVEGTELSVAMESINPSVPWIFSHHDLIYRIQAIRYDNKSLKHRMTNYACQRAETKLFRSVRQVLTGSATDAKRLAQFGAHISVIPTAYDEPPFEGQQVVTKPQVVHLGSLETTANRSGLKSYLQEAHQLVTSQCDLELWLIGDSSHIKAPLKTLLNLPHITLMGYVEDLKTVLRPYDISILPYEHDTGYRTKLPLLLGYGQVVVSTRAAVAGTQIPGLEQVCVLVDRVRDFPEAICRLAADSHERERLGRAARAFFEMHFTHAVVLEQYQNLLSNLEGGAKTPN